MDGAGIVSDATAHIGDVYRKKYVRIAAEPVTSYDLWVGGEHFHEEKLTVTGGGGTATYDPEANTLTLNNYNYSGTGYVYFNGYNCGIYYGGEDVLNLVLVGENSITVADNESSNSYDFYSGGELTVSGTGNLTV